MSNNKDHKSLASSTVIAFSVLTISDTRTIETDSSGKLIVSGLSSAGHQKVEHCIVKDDSKDIVDTLTRLSSDCQLIITTGGTGVSRRDNTIDALLPIFEIEIPGFGELFRILSYEEVGAAAILSRATAGIFNQTAIFCLPGSTNAVNLALDKIILPEIQHLLWELLVK